jgi:hypothetical protein
MNKYQPLAERLAGRSENEWLATFSELEAVLGFPLPKAARTTRGWWGNDPARSHARAWAAQGWQVGDVDHTAERVLFRRGLAPAGIQLETVASGEIPNGTPAPAVGQRTLAPEAAPLAAAAPMPAAETVQPPAMREAAKTASSRMHATRALGATALVTAGVAVVAGLGAAVVRGVMRRRAS